MNKRKCVSFLLAVMLIVSIMFQTTINKVQAAPEFIGGVNANFDTYSTSYDQQNKLVAPEGFAIPADSTEQEISPAAFENKKGKSIKFASTAVTGKAGDLTLTKNFGPNDVIKSGKVVFETKVLAEDNKLNRTFRILTSQTNFIPVLFNMKNEIVDKDSVKITNFVTGKWYRVFIFVDLDTDKIKVGVQDGNNIYYSAEKDIANADIVGYQYYQKRYAATGTTYIDDIRIWRQPTAFDVTCPDLTDDMPEELQPSFTFDFNTEVDTSTLSKISVANAVYSVTYSETNPYSCQISFNKELEPLTNYEINLNGVKDIFGNELTNKVFNFTTQPKEEPKTFIIGTPSFSKGFGPQRVPITKIESGLINGTVEITNITQSPQKATLIMALYSENSLTPIDIAMVEGNMQSGVNTLSASFTVPSDNQSYKIKIFVWKDMLSMKPLSDMKVFDDMGIHN